jgi:hypothetical protein
MDLNNDERELIESMPNLRPQASLAASNVWIIQWLHEADQQTGAELHRWMQSRRPGWSHLVICRSKADVIAAIDRAALFARQKNLRPILHIDTHGCESGIEGTDGKGGVEQIRWAELRAGFARLNAVTGCNLLVFMAACTGFAGIGTLLEFDRAPALALVGCDGIIFERQLLDGTKEFYRRLLANDSTLHEMASAASQEAGDDVWFEPEVFPTLARESLIDMIMERGRNGRLTQSDSTLMQEIWDRLMMIDLAPENRDRFKLDVARIVEMAMSFYGSTRNTGGVK